MPKLKIKDGRIVVLPTPEESAAITAAAMSDPDAIPLTDEEWEAVKPTLRRGRPLEAVTKERRVSKFCDWPYHRYCVTLKYLLHSSESVSIELTICWSDTWTSRSIISRCVTP